ncbi:energy-coupling factor transporter transmembrane component T [Actinotalea sp.]|uniref:energy-coupling factor transporter transmembrane component T n=1 Tax=Actinotalea sp. TaxID=1872145 RepID=UPI002B850E7E|nr:energy-coupling factor transporter transmembrane component T [Actinotalea sp.]HQY33587.1 energy-coupling factor transporter transmembrane component T [Actinotalea sp.]HRA50819.1 energy-coupling factor transporter transmembrane component T [Actinotalea sp.]
MRPWADPVGLYRPGTTIVHRTPVAVRFGLLTALGIALVVLRGPWTAVVALLVTVLVAMVARLPLRGTVRGLAPVLVTAALVGAYQSWARGWPLGVEVAADLVTLVLAATVVTATTPTDVLLDLMARAVRPLRRVGLEPETFALAVALMLRAIPALGALFTEVRDAARARGLERSPRALLVPFAVRTVARARLTGEALAARGIGD